MILLDALAHPKSYGDVAQAYALGVGEKSNEISKFINSKFFETQRKIWTKKLEDDMYETLGLGDRYKDNTHDGYSIFYKGYSSWGVTMTLWTLKFSKLTAKAEINPDKHIQEVKLNWKLSELLTNETLDFRDYCSNKKGHGGIFEESGSNLTTTLQSTCEGLPDYGFFVQDVCFTGSPYSKIEGSQEICIYNDLSAEDVLGGFDDDDDDD